MKYYAVIDTNVVVSSMLKHVKSFVVTPKEMLDIIEANAKKDAPNSNQKK